MLEFEVIKYPLSLEPGEPDDGGEVIASTCIPAPLFTEATIEEELRQLWTEYGGSGVEIEAWLSPETTQRNPPLRVLVGCAFTYRGETTFTVQPNRVSDFVRGNGGGN